MLRQNEKWTDKQFKEMNDKFVSWKMSNPQASPTEQLSTLLRLYEKHTWGITSRDLHLGKTFDYLPNDDGTYSKVEAACRGYFYGNPSEKSAPLECHFEREKFKLSDGKRLSYKQYIVDGKMLKEERDAKIRLATDVQTTGKDMGDSESLLETGVVTTFGTTAGVVPPVFLNMLLELVSLKAFMKNFVSIQPMPDMTFKFPLKTSVIEDSAEMQRTALPTLEGRAGTEYAIKWSNWEVNGWKYQRHAELTNEIQEMLDKYLNVTRSYMEDLAEGQALLWDYAAIEGIQTMIVKGIWRYFDGTDWDPATEVEIPFGKASVLTTNALKNYLFQDLSGGAAHGTIYKPDVATGDEFKWDLSDVRDGSGNSDEVFELLMALGTLAKNKNSAIEYFIFTDSRITEQFFRDDRVKDMTINTGNPAFQNERGYLGKVSIAGSSTFVDLWESPPTLIPSRATDDAAPDAAFPIIGGAYGKGWHQGVFSPVSMRVDEGFEVIADAGTVDRLRPTESKVLTTSSKGSSWPGDYHHIVIGWAMLDDSHA